MQVVSIWLALLFIGGGCVVLYPATPFDQTLISGDGDGRAVLTGRATIAHSVPGGMLSVVNGLMLGAVGLGIHRRMLIAWKLGWVVVWIGCLEFLLSGLSVTLPLAGGERWAASVAVLVCGAWVGLASLRWWKGQRSYFVS